MPPSKKHSSGASGVSGSGISKQKAKAKLIDLASLVKEGATSSAPTKMKAKASSAVFSLIKAKYQKGDRTGENSGAIYHRGRPRFGQNDKYKALLEKLLLTERLRWNDELKLYTARVYTATQARRLLAAAKTLDGGDKDLPEDIDESVFEEATAAHVTLFPITVHEGPTSQSQEMLAASGMTYPFKDGLKSRGFAFNNTVNDVAGVNLWLAPVEDIDKEELVSLFEEYGFEVEEFDGTKDGVNDE